MLKEANGLIAIPPGETLKEQLSLRHMSQKEFASRIGYSEKHLSRLINGEVELTPETAVRLENILGIPAQFWMNYEGIYRTTLLKIAEYEHLEDESELAKRFPYSEMSKHGWVKETRDQKARVMNLRNFFEVASLSFFKENLIPKVAARRLEMTSNGDMALIASVQRARLLARERETSPMDVKGLKAALPKIRSLLNRKDGDVCIALASELAKYGVALIYLEPLKGSYLHGLTFLDNYKIVVALSPRGQYADKFYFSLFHEIGHIVMGHLVRDDLGEKEEKEVDIFAADALIDKREYARFVGDNDFSERSIIAFSKRIEIPVGVVVGRLQKDDLLGYDRLNYLREKIELPR